MTPPGEEDRPPERDEEIERLKAEIARLRKRLDTLTPSLPELIERRGFAIKKSDPSDGLFIPRDPGQLERFYRLMASYAFRLFLRDVIKHGEGFEPVEVARYPSLEVTRGYIEFLLEAGMLEKSGDGKFRTSGGPIRSFGPTLEWFVSEVLEREFSIETMRDVHLSGRSVGGDYDVLGKLDPWVLYVETKSSPPRQVEQNHVRAFLKRTSELGAAPAVFLMDTELRMKDKLVPMFSEELAAIHPESGEKVERLERELFRYGHKIFIINAKGGIERNLASVLNHYQRESL